MKTDVQQTMLNYPVKILREFTQYPFIAENVQVKRRLAPRQAEAAAAAPPRFRNEDEAGDFAKMESTLWPADVARLASDFLKHYPDSRLAGSAQVAHDGAVEAAQILRRTDVRLYRSAFQPGADAAPEARPSTSPRPAAATRTRPPALGRALQPVRRGRRPVRRRDGRNADVRGRFEGLAAVRRGARQRHAPATTSRSTTGAPTSRCWRRGEFEARARDLGYTPPPSLDNTRK